MVTGYPSDCDRTAVYAVTVTTKIGDQEVTKRYEAPTAEEAMRMAGEYDMVAKPKDDDTVEIVTLQTVAPADTSPV